MDNKLAKEFSIELALRLQDPFNKVDFKDTQKLAKRIFKIISVIRFGIVRDDTPMLLNKEQGVQVSDTTTDDSSNVVTRDDLMEK